MSLAYLIRRLVAGFAVLFIVATLTFFVLRIIPGGPFDRDRVLPEKIRQNVEAKYGLDQPLWRQYATYMAGLAQGDLGPSFKYIGRSVNDVLADSFPVSLLLGLAGLAVAILVGIPAGLISAARAGRGWDVASLLISTLGISAPTFVLGAVLIYVFSFRLRWLPPALWEGPAHLVLPALALGLVPAALITRLTRSALIETLGEDYIRTAFAKGLSERAVLFKHAFKNAIPPVVTFMGLLVANLITGSFIVEKIFAIPGMGKFFITAVTNRDYPLVVGTTLIYTLLVVLANLAVDLAYRWLDPRIRMGGEG